jgi:hypothetical protein
LLFTGKTEELLNIQILFSTPLEAIHIGEFVGEQTIVEEQTILEEQSILKEEES